MRGERGTHRQQVREREVPHLDLCRCEGPDGVPVNGEHQTVGGPLYGCRHSVHQHQPEHVTPVMDNVVDSVTANNVSVLLQLLGRFDCRDKVKE